MAHLLLSSCGAVEQAAALDEQRQEVLRLKFEEQTKRAAAQAAEGLVVEGAVGGLRPWRDVVEPHEDVASGNFQLAEFAADLREVHAGTAQPGVRRPGRVLPPHLPHPRAAHAADRRRCAGSTASAATRSST